MKKKIDFRKMKYWLPAIAYFPLLLLGWLVIDMFHIEISDKTNKSLVMKNEYNADLPSAQVSDRIGDKISNMRNQYGSIKELSPIATIESDKDSLKDKKNYSSSLTEEESALIREKMRADSLEALLKKQGSSRASSGRDQSPEEFTSRLSAADRRKYDQLRKRGVDFSQLERDLGISLDSNSVSRILKTFPDDEHVRDASVDSVVQKSRASRNKVIRKQAVEELAADAQESAVVKKVTETSAHFNTISGNDDESNLIVAIIDENIKVVEGSRVRLRLLDDVYIDNVLIKKNTYLYAEFSGFGNQRVKGRVGSILYGDQLLKCNLSLYDMDGLEGLYVPESAFLQTAKDIGSSALQSGGMNMNSVVGTSGSSSLTSLATNAVQQAYQRTTQAISKAIKKNKVKLKYGSHVYLINSKSLSSKRSGAAAGSSSAQPSQPNGRARVTASANTSLRRQ